MDVRTRPNRTASAFVQWCLTTTFTCGRASDRHARPREMKVAGAAHPRHKLPAAARRRQPPYRWGAGLGTGPTGAPGGCYVVLYGRGDGTARATDTGTPSAPRTFDRRVTRTAARSGTKWLLQSGTHAGHDRRATGRAVTRPVQGATAACSLIL